MPKKDFDYRFCVMSSLQVLKDHREKLCTDSSYAHNSTIYNGLHEFESSSQRDLYFQLYLTEWLDTHWNKMNDLIDGNQEFRISAQKQMLLFFAEYFSKFIEECSSTGQLAKIAVPDLLKIKKKSLDDMIKVSERWKEQNEQLKSDSKKHREKFRRLIESKQKEGCI